MAELASSSKLGIELEIQETEKPAENKNRLEKLLPIVSVRVLLVEADDSTRQIIAALLRKCSYKVSAVSDGLKALEVIKGRAHSIDLILTEVELPSISGYALLTLIMEHDVCKNIPVIMMSSQDSVSMVYKCMLKGATDFLVKPLRINELRNLWQHVWRKKALSSSGPGPPKEDKIEATDENNAVSNHSSGYMERKRECIERGSDAQSSCTKPRLEIEGADNKHNHTEEGCNPDISNTDNVMENLPIEAIDLIGAFDINYPKSTLGDFTLADNVEKSDSFSALDLSLRRPHPSSSVNQVNDEMRRLKHSDASAFSRYRNKPLQTQEVNSEKQISQREICQPIPVKGIRIENATNVLVSARPQIVYPPQSGSSPSPGPTTINNLQFCSHSLPSNSQQFFTIDRKAENGDTRFYTSNVDTNSISVVNEEGLIGVSHGSMQRLAALNKFRQKRKDRCFEKKVRYESRKKLAEQRPRVKGQFVRQEPNNGSQLGSSSAR